MTIIDVATTSEKGVVNQSTSIDQRHDEKASPAAQSKDSPDQREMEQDELQDQRRGKAISVPTR
jgi:hypothetical protein